MKTLSCRSELAREGDAQWQPVGFASNPAPTDRGSETIQPF